MLGTALKNLATQYGLTISGDKAYGYLLGSFVTLTEKLFSRRLSIYVGSVNVHLPEGEELSPAAKCSALIVDMITKASGTDNIYGLLRNRFIPALVLNHSGSVVSLNFRRDENGWNGLMRFISEMLPHITPLTAPLQCCHCGRHTGGQGYPVQIAADTIVPMHADCQKECAKAYAASSPWLPGVIGAGLGTVLGTLAWALLLPSGFLASFSTLFILLLALGGYRLLHGKAGYSQALVLTCCLLFGILAGNLTRCFLQLHREYLAYGSVVGNMMRESVYMRITLKSLVTSGSAWLQLALDFLFGLIYSISSILLTSPPNKGCAESSAPKAMPGQA